MKVREKKKIYSIPEDTYFVRHSHLGPLALGCFTVSLGRRLGLISTGHDCCIRKVKASHIVTCFGSSHSRYGCSVCTLPVCVCDVCAEPHSECVWLGACLLFLYPGAHRRGIMGRETNPLRSETRHKRKTRIIRELQLEGQDQAEGHNCDGGK